MNQVAHRLLRDHVGHGHSFVVQLEDQGRAGLEEGGGVGSGEVDGGLVGMAAVVLEGVADLVQSLHALRNREISAECELENQESGSGRRACSTP
ncbi:hypothetical protein ACFPOI_17085 [Nonomuraea angiospora]|uniref:Uncharacterized protein n=1 Tax=Nonomuraea angiospora TaxID=46172 RepID=A0ABR9MHH6_9ACTN|nr:hypothetical protein [Nonomuraea angiospora]MBE1592358.1 hypothetical protein [Nonomuraea angiospora]